ncbi:hypothetical protein Pelo_17513 [Pelomyxa schiedti]|nr:hypothetical protein Pelo_17513 [Pelomyxa schiedti]
MFNYLDEGMRYPHIILTDGVIVYSCTEPSGHSKYLHACPSQFAHSISFRQVYITFTYFRFCEFQLHPRSSSLEALLGRCFRLNLASRSRHMFITMT